MVGPVSAKSDHVFGRGDRDGVAVTSAQLLSAAPLVAVLQRLKKDLDGIAARAPQSDVAFCLKSVVDELARGMKEAEDIAVCVTIETLAKVTGRPESTLTRICRNNGAKCGASKVHGAWSIHLPTFLNFWRRGDHNLKEVA